MSENIERALASQSSGPFSRNYYVIAFSIAPKPKNPHKLEPLDLGHGYERAICLTMCVLFGKRFDSHGLTECFGHYQVPEVDVAHPLRFTSTGPFNHSSRKDLELPLNFSELQRVESLLFDPDLDQHFRNTFFAAARFYYRSLQTFDSDPDVAYLDLITCGEILAGYFKYPDEVVYGVDMLAMLKQVRAIPKDGKTIAGKFKGRMRQIKRRFTRTILDLLTDYFFLNSEAKEPGHGLERLSAPHPGFNRARISIEERIEEAYNVRSSYVHTGAEFGFLVAANGLMNEAQLGWYTEGMNGLNKDLAKAVSLAPTYLGLERVMRYCLLRFLHVNGVQIDPRLDGPGPPLPCPTDRLGSADVITRKKIEYLAREFWEAAGRPEGQDVEFWTRAERFVMAEWDDE